MLVHNEDPEHKIHRALLEWIHAFAEVIADVTEDEEEAEAVFDEAAWRTVDLGNSMAQADEDADVWDIADGLLAGAVQYWLYSREPCDNPRCEDCAPLSTAEKRVAEMARLLRQYAEESEYYHSQNDSNVGRA
jgi:hypothetical protein